MKFPLFIKHFIQHKNKDTQLSLSEFIEMHYANGDVKDADYDEDMKLPFKTPTTFSNNNVISFTQSNYIDLAIKPRSLEQNFYSDYQEAFLPSSYLSSIWQPPKFIC